MKEYTLQDFVSYYRNTYVRHPDNLKIIGKLCTLRNTHELKFWCGENDPSEEELRLAPNIDYTKLEWEHVKRPILGYRHFNNGSQLYYYFSHRSNMQRSRGLHENILGSEEPNQFTSAVLCSKFPYEPRNFLLNKESAEELFYPNFVSIQKAVYLLEKDKRAMGFAINHDMAITLGVSAETPFLLLYNGTMIATSLDGAAWTTFNPDFEGIISRCLKKGERGDA